MDQSELVAACFAAAKEIAGDVVAKSDQPPLDDEETALLEVGLMAGVAGALRVLEQQAA